MQTRNKKRITGIIALALIFVIAVTAALYFAAFFSPATHSVDLTATVSGDISGGVDVYISGDGVTRDEDGKYTIPSGTDVEITVINNTAVSSGLTVTTGAESPDNENVVTIGGNNFARVTNVTQNLSIEVNGSLATEEGTSLFTAYELSDSTDFLALSKILAAVSGDDTDENDDVTKDTLPTIVSYLAEFGFDDESWYTTDESGNTILNSANATVGNVQTALKNAQTALSTAYFRLTGDVMLNEAQTGATTITTGYFGLGSRRGEAFQGVLDFDGYSVTLNMDIPEVTSENFTSSTAGSATHNILSAGLFNYIYGDGTHACAILGADVRGTISLTSGELTSSATNTDYRVYIGGVAGSIGKNVVLDGISSSVSVSVQSSTDSGNSPISVYAGGVFGFSGADIDYWSDVSYTGNYSEISVTSSSGSANLPARTVVGALAGVIQNAYVNNFTATLRGANILADSTSNGNAVAGGLAGIIFASSNAYEETNGLSSSLHIRGININASGATVSALTASTSNRPINPDSVFVVGLDGTMTSADAAIAGGLIGRVYGTNITEDDFETLYISEIDFGAVSGSEEFTIRSGTSNANSRAMTFAGGVVGYVSNGENFIDVSYNPGGEASTGAEGDAVIFSGNVVVNSVQNGVGPAYAGGIFGYNAFKLPNSTTEYTFNLTSESASLEVTAEQTAETANAGTLYDVCAGLYTSVLPDAYSINNLTFNANNATATARRLAGSTAVGDIAAGAIAGKANGNGGGNNSAVIQNLTVELNTCSINAFGYSFDSEYTTEQGNNVYAGGVIGYVRNYGVYGGNVGLSNISVTFDRSLNNSDYAVYGIQNAVSGNGDYKTEGYVGGMFGMMHGGYATGLLVDGTVKDRTIIYFNSTNDPNTACVGGLIGATRFFNGNESYAVTNSSVRDVHVAGRAYVSSETFSSGVTSSAYDLFVGGALGVFGVADESSATHYVTGITVENCDIESIGDQMMLTYAGGVVGGAWWVSNLNMSNLISRNNAVTSSSASYSAYAGGAIGQMEGDNTISFSNAFVIDSVVEAITYSSSENAYAAGICGRMKGNTYSQYSVSNAVVTAVAPNSSTRIAGIAVIDNYLNDPNPFIGGNDSGDYAHSNNRNNYFVAANISVSSIDRAYAYVSSNNGQEVREYEAYDWGVFSPAELDYSYAIALRGSGAFHTRSAQNSHTMSVGNSVGIYEGLGISSASGNIAGRQYRVVIVGNDEVTLNGLTFTPKEQGTYYAQILIDGELLCSYPIIVGNASTSEGVTITTPDFTMSSGDGTTTNAYVSSQNSHNYWSSAFGNSTQVDFSNIHTDNFGDTEKPNIGGSIFTIHGNHSSDAVRGTDNKDNYLYFENQIKVDSRGLTGAYIRFEATGSGYLVVKAQTNRIDNAIFPSLYVYDNTHKNDYSEIPPKGVSATDDENYYSSEATTDLKEFRVYVPQAGTYYFGFIGNGCNIYTLDMQYEGDGAHSANSGTTYFQIYAGDMSYVQNVIVSNSNVYMPKIYLVTNSDYLLGYADGDENNNIHTADEIRGKATQITQNLGNATSITGVMSYFNVSTTDDGLGLNISPVLGNTEGAALVLVYDCGETDYYVIIEVVPNAIVGLSIEPAADTPPRATTTDTSGEKIYIYAAGSDDRPETVRLEAEVEYRFPYNRFIVDVEFTKDSSTTATNSEVQPNGTIIVKGTSGQKVVVNCSPISDGSAIDNMSATLTIEISNSITVVADDMSGTSYAPVSDNDAVAGYPFSFTLDPNPGYGLNPELTIELQRENGNDYTNIMSFDITLPQKRTDGEVGEITYVYNGSTYRVTETAELDAQTGIYTYSVKLDNIGISSFVLTYQYNVSTGVYTITLPAVMFVSTLNGYTLSRVRISASFEKVYSIMFDLGEWADDGSDNGGINSRYFIYQVKNGAAINSDLYNSITGELDSLFSRTQNRAGFTFKGFYTTTSANTLASYGDSFTEMFKNGDGNSVIRGSMNFYARWNYTVALHAPSGIGIESGLSSSLLEENLKDGTDNSIIPIDIQHGFSFEITGTYAGTPRVEVYTVGADGALVPLAVTNVNGVYTIDNPEEITGTIHIYVYADNLTLAVSDTMDATQTSIDLRKDGIFTARYTVNYGSGVDAANGHAKEIIFSFANSADGTALSLPAGTRLRLFYHANGSAVAVGYYEVGSGGITSVAATDFKPLTGSDSSGSGDSATIFAFEGTLTSESLYLVVTLPNNDTDNFSGISSLNITVNAYSTTLTTTPYETAGVTYGNSESGDGTESGGEAENDSKVQNATDPENTSIQATVNLFNIVHRYGNPSGNTLTFVENDPYANTETAAPEDVRHADKYYVWRIAATDWNNNRVSASGATPVITDGYIYIAASTALALNNFSGTIELMEVTNTQYPAAGAVVWTYTSGN